MIIIPSRICNTSNCNYCGVHKQDFEYKYFLDNFNLDLFFEKIEVLSKKSNDKKIRFFGGEPFLQIKILKSIIDYSKAKKLNYEFIINTNLSIINDEDIKYIFDNDIKLIFSCNGDLYSHCLSRGVNEKNSLNLYRNIQKIINYKIKYQLNIVTQNETVDRLNKNLKFIAKKLGAKTINLLPVSYNGWKNEKVKQFEKQLNTTLNDIKKSNLDLEFINKNINNDVGLFENDFVIDSDGNIYPNMVIIEKFFINEKKNILISSLTKTKSEIISDLKYYDGEEQKIYSAYINKILQQKFGKIMPNDIKISTIFGNFLKKL